LPGQYSDLKNPLRELAGQQLRDVEREGTVLYQKNCRPCHGTKADGDGPLARGLRLQPIDFTDPGTIATVVEAYDLWRIHEGALGLPGIATPWNSAMPAWKDELQDEEIWRIIMAEYRIAGVEPRIPEGSEH
jgi:mono/diheme cytochrome c family protein